MVATASPAVAERIGLEPFYFIRRQLVYLVLALVIIIATSFLSPTHIRRFCVLGFIFFLTTLVIVLIYGTEIKGSKRWLSLPFFSFQPSEFIKPIFAVLTGWVLSLKYQHRNFPSFKIAIALYGVLIGLIVMQPDLGMAVTISTVWAGQLFLAGLSMLWIVAIILCSLVGLVSAYLFLPHVAKRINSFIDPSGNDNYQINKSLEAFVNGGIYGTGPGEGTVKQQIPDCHTDFIFAVVGEELGIIACIFVICLFAFIVLRGFMRIAHEADLFKAFAVAGLLMQFGTQAIINMGVALNLLPTKGMTLPFISYGGSSMVATALAMGMMLALTKKRYGMVRFQIYRKMKDDETE